MSRTVDVCFVNPGDRREIYQGLGAELAAIEPPFWIGVMATFLRNRGLEVAVVDANAENLAPAETAARVKEIAPRLVAVIVYGSQPSASTQTMPVAGRICRALKENGDLPVLIGGLHPSALPERTLLEESVDFVADGEGPLTIQALVEVLKSGRAEKLKDVPGLWYRTPEGAPASTRRAPDFKDLDAELGPVAWDLFPMERYRAHNWHCFDHIHDRKPYAAIYTSLGCPYKCVFCCINTPFEKPGIRYRSPESVVDELGLLVERYGVKNVKIVDEMFVLHEKHYMGIAELLVERGYDLNFWCYARVDTIRDRTLEVMKRAGFNWFGVGIESANAEIRDGAAKKLRVADVVSIVRKTQEAGIRVGCNYIFGLPFDTIATMQETLEMSMEINSEWANFYCAMAYPGSPLHREAKAKGLRLPDDPGGPGWIGYSQHAYETLPLPTDTLSAAEVLSFRDRAFDAYFAHPAYHAMLEEKFGADVRNHIKDMSRHKLRRKLLE